MATARNAVGSACPYCLIMFDDAIKYTTSTIR